jgi:integrase
LQIKITKRTVDALPAAAVRYTAWDEDLAGFGLRITPTGERVYVLKFRLGGRQRWFTIGRHGSPWTPEAARQQAKILAGDIARGMDPAERRDADRAAMNFAELCNAYLAEGVAHKKASTLRVDRGRIELHLKPLLGRKRLDEVSRADVERLLNAVKNGRTAAQPSAKRRAGSVAAGGSGVAAQCVALASTVLKFAVDRGLRRDNPASGVKKPAVRKMQRFLSEAELRRLADELNLEDDAGAPPHPLAAIRLLALTGCRRGEIVGLRWRNVDFERRLLHLEDSKTREKIIYLSPAAVDVLREIPRVQGNDFVIAGTLAGRPSAAVDKVWARVRARAGLKDVRLHDLRHTFASVGAGASIGLPVIGRLLGHSQTSTTARYAHLGVDPVRQAADAIGTTIAAAMGNVSALKNSAVGD